MHSRENMINAIQRAAGRKRGTPTILDWEIYSESSDPSATTIIRFFGFWNLAMKEAGLSPHRQSDRWRQMRW